MSAENETPSRDEHRLHLVDSDWASEVSEETEETERNEEPLLWSGRASLLLALGPCTQAALLLAAAIALAHGWLPWGWSPPARPAWLSPWFVDVRLWSTLAIGWGLRSVLELRSMRYELTPRFLRVSSGFLVRRTVEREWQQFRRVELVEPWLLRWAGRAHVALNFPGAGCGHCGTPQHWTWTLHGVTDGAGLRRLLHRSRDGRG